jgi:pentatricopeptide repeat domain-containing protein 1
MRGAPVVALNVGMGFLPGHAYAAAISACAAGGLWQKAMELFDEMLLHQIKPDVVSCTALITALASDGQYERGERVVGWMIQVCLIYLSQDAVSTNLS